VLSGVPVENKVNFQVSLNGEREFEDRCGGWTGKCCRKIVAKRAFGAPLDLIVGPAGCDLQGGEDESSAAESCFLNTI
jgi:hypothetical protein